MEVVGLRGPAIRQWSRRRWLGYGAGTAGSAALLAFALSGRAEFDWTEAVGFITGVWCVWLTVVEDCWNFPIGNASDVFYFVVFLNVGLYADSLLQVVYLILGFLGWWWWLRGGPSRSALVVRRAARGEALACAIAAAGGTLLLWWLLGRFTPSTVPFWDGLTTALSLVAQYLLCRKLLENWYVWMTADVIYVGLYGYKHLLLTAALYVLFLGICVAGLRRWRRVERASRDVARPLAA